MEFEKNKHFDKIKKIFLETMNANGNILELSNGDLLTKIREDFCVAKNSTDVKQIRNILTEKCRNLAGFIDDGYAKQIEIDQHFTGEYFCSSQFIALATHFSYIEYLQGGMPSFYKNIFGVLHNFLGNVCYYDVDSAILKQIFKYALYIFLLNPNAAVNRCYICEKAKIRCDAIKRLAVDYVIVQDDITFTEETLKTIHKRFEDNIKEMDGFVFLQTLQKRALLPHYEKSMDRYRLHRHKGVGIRADMPETPFNFLIQLAIKTLQFGNYKNTSDVLSEEKYQKIIKDSQDFLTALSLVTNSIFEDIYVDMVGLPKYLFDNMFYEALVIPEQYNTKFLLEVMKSLFYPVKEKYNNYRKFTTYSIDAYIHIARKILESKEHYFDFIKLKKLTKVNKEELINILNDMSIDVSIINENYTSILKMTNSKDYPLIKLKDGTYYFYDSKISGWGFYRNLYNRLKNIDKDLNSNLGNWLEDYIRKLFRTKNIPYVCGKYYPKKGQEEECDIIVQDDEVICGIESKYCLLNKYFEIGDDASLHSVLGKGMIKAQYQLLKHRLDLLKKKTLQLHNDHENREDILCWNNRRIFSLSLCFPEYRFLTTRIVAKKILDMLLICDVSVRDKSREHDLVPLHEVQKKILDSVSDKDNSILLKDRIFDDSIFLSLQQLYMTIKMCKNANEFIGCMQHYLSVHNGEMDYYELLLRFHN